MHKHRRQRTVDFNEYVIRTRETVIYAPEVALNYLIPGLLLEALELEKAWIDSEIKEAGDCLWFCARITDELSFALEFEPFGTDTTVGCKNMISYHAWNICDAWVKSLRDNTVISSDGRILRSIAAIAGYISDLASVHDMTLSDIMQANVDKLADRKARGVLSGSGDSR